MTKRQIYKVRPIGGVQCSNCGEDKSSGNRITISIQDEGTETQFRCDRCTQSLREWYDQRSDEHGWV